MLSSGQLTRPVHVLPMRSFAAHRDTRPGAPRDGPPQHPGGRRELADMLAEVSSRRDARHRRLARRVWPPRVRRMHMHRATHAITGVGITVMIKQLVMIMSLMILMIAQRQAALAMRVVLPPALPPRAPAPPRAPRACAAPSCRAAAPVRPRVRPRVRTYVRRSCVSQGGRVRVGPGVSAPGCVDARRRRRRRRARRGSPATCYRRTCCGR